MSLGVVIEGMTIAAFMILLLGGKQRREQGWSVLSIMVVIAAVVQAAAMSLTVSQVTLPHKNSDGRSQWSNYSQAYLYENDSRFFVGWFLDKSWVMCTVSWSVQAFCAIAITIAALTLPSEGGYELIPDHA
jgi:formate hydrogenlyase subunit 3/multisubunit Na+/H+ antiporter MnhD subunit